LKQTFYILGIILGLLGCNGKTEKVVENSSIQKVKLHQLQKLFVVGNFDDDKQKDTISEHNFSKLTRAEINSSADPSKNEWDTVVKWFHNQKADLYLTVDKNNRDTLHLGTAQGLYCLINIGDNSADGKDEIALVVDNLDFSRMNNCAIYSICNNKWKLLKQFKIHEDAFNFTAQKASVFQEIKGFLEKKNRKWLYIDYSEMINSNQENIQKMTILKLNKCD
jgi:hypothetical protein